MNDEANEFVVIEIKRDRAKCITKICISNYIDNICNMFVMHKTNLVSVLAEPRLYLKKKV